MEVMALLFFVGVVFVGSAALAFAWTARLGTFDHSERLALLPLEDAASSEPTPPKNRGPEGTARLSEVSENHREEQHANATHRV